MKSSLRVLRYLLVTAALVAGLSLLAGWWLLHRSLPQLDGAVFLSELKDEVRVDRDLWGVPHVRANSLEDLLTAQGYVQAQDRLWQMDILRRAAAGELSEVFGPATLELDRENRVLGIRAAADREASDLDEQTRRMLEAYARGVNRYIRERRRTLPWEFIALRYEPQPWTPRDTFLVFGYTYKVLTSTWKAEWSQAKVAERVGPQRARELFSVDSPLDHFIVGQLPPAEKAAFPRVPPRPSNPQATGAAVATSFASRERDLGPLRNAQVVLEKFEDEVAGVVGSNNWVVDGTHTYSGKPLLANDTHLPLDVPCIWYLIQLTAPGWNVKGFTFPGVPLVIIGQNDRIAWGFTNNGADVQDLYVETFNPANAREYRVNGQWVAAEHRKEIIRIKGRPDELLEVVLTRHGPIVRREGERAYALRWTATEPAGMTFAYPLLGWARNWEEFRELLRRVPGPAQNAVYADVDGNIGFVVAANIPVRKRGDGSVPVPGDTDDYEWIGYIPFPELPQVLNPAGGVIATANARVAGPGYRWHLTDRWQPPYRTARIYELLAGRTELRPAECLAIQTDIVSLPHRFLAEKLARAGEKHSPTDPRARELIAQLGRWDGRAQSDSVEITFVEYTRRALLGNLLRPQLGDEIRLYRWPRSMTFLENVLRDQPAHWLPPGYGSYDELLVASADQAVQQLEADSAAADFRQATQISAWGWGRFNPLEILHPLGRSGLLRRLLSVGPVEQDGAVDTVKAALRSHGPAMRFVADLANSDNSLMNITLGESGQYLSPYYRDQFPAWFEGRGLPSAFTDAAEEKTRRHHLRLLAASPQTEPAR